MYFMICLAKSGLQTTNVLLNKTKGRDSSGTDGWLWLPMREWPEWTPTTVRGELLANPAWANTAGRRYSE